MLTHHNAACYHHRLLTNIATYRADIASFTDTFSTLTSTLQLNTQTLNNELKPQLAALRAELRAAEDEQSGLEDRLTREVEDREVEIEDEIDGLKQKEIDLTEEINRTQSEHDERYRTLNEEFQVFRFTSLYII